MKGKVFTAQEVQAMLNGSKVMFREVIKPSAGLQSKWASVQGLSKCPTNYLCEVNSDLGAQFQHPLADTHQSYGYVDKMSPYGWFKCPYQVGQKIFCKESWFESGTWGQTHPEDDEYKAWHPRGYQQKSHIHYAANGLPSIRGENSWNLEKPYCDSFIPDQDSYFWRKRSPLHMPQWASRLILQIKEIGVEKLGDISESDCMKEGCFLNQDDMGAPVFGFCEEEVDQELGYRKAQDAFKVYWNATHKKPEEQFEGNPWVWKILFEVVK